MAGPAVPLCSSCWLYLPWSPALSRYPTDAPVDFKWKGASSLSHLSFVLWRHRMEARGSVKILFCRTAVFQKRRETRMRSCWPRQRSRATSIQSIVSDGWYVGMDVWIRCQLSLPGSLQNFSLCLMEWEIYQDCSSLWCNFWQSPDESPSLMLSLVHTQHVQVSANWFYPAFRFHHSCDVCRFGSVPWRADTDYYLAKDYNLMIIPCSWLCDGVLLKLFKIFYYWHICLSAFYSSTGFSL